MFNLPFCAYNTTKESFKKDIQSVYAEVSSEFVDSQYPFDMDNPPDGYCICVWDGIDPTEKIRIFYPKSTIAERGLVHEMCHIAAHYLLCVYGFDVNDLSFINELYGSADKSYVSQALENLEEYEDISIDKYNKSQEPFCLLMDRVLSYSDFEKPKKLKIIDSYFHIEEVKDMVVAAYQQSIKIEKDGWILIPIHYQLDDEGRITSVYK